MHFRHHFTSSAFMLLLHLLILFYPWRVFSQQEQISQECKAVTLQVSLNAGQSYAKRIGDLTFRIDARRRVAGNEVIYRDGWSYSLVDESERDYIAPADLPLRFNPMQFLGPGYSLTAQESLRWNREAQFLLNRSDYERIEPLWKYALWPADAPDPKSAAKNYLSTLEQLRGGLLRLKILDFSISSDEAIRSALLEIELMAPEDFYFDPLMKPSVVACPGPMIIKASPF